MDNSRMSTADMLQYCEEALAWEDFGPIDIFFFQSVKKILLGQCSATEEPEEVIDDLMGIERPVRDVELEPEYDKYADIYYGEEGDDDIPDYSRSKEDEAFDEVLSGGGGFFDQEQKNKAADSSQTETGVSAAAEAAESQYTENTDSAYTFSAGSGYSENSEGAYTFSDDPALSTYSLSEQTETAVITETAGEPVVPEAPAEPAVPVTPSVNISVAAEKNDIGESEFNELRESLEAAAAAVEKSIKDK